MEDEENTKQGIMITSKNYFQKQVEVKVSDLPTNLKEGYDFVKEITKGHTTWAYYNSDEDIKATVDEYLANLSDFLIQKHPAGPTEQSTVAKNADIQKGTNSVRQVEHIEEEIKFIKRYVGLHNKVKTPSAILAFIKSLQHSIVQKFILKSSPFAKDIQRIQDNLVKAYNKMKGEATFTIAKADLGRLVAIAGGEQVYPSITVIKRFIGLQDKSDTKKIDTFVKYLENLAKSKKITKDDPYADKVESIYKTIKRRKGDRIPISKSELKGLEGIIGSCACEKSLGRIYNTAGRKLRPCKRGTYTDAQHQGACSHNKGLGVLSAEEMGNRQFESLDFDYPWNNLMGKPAKNFTIMFHGEPGSGKTTLLLKFAEYLANNFGNVLYISSEEHEAATLTDKINELLHPKPQNLDFAPDLVTPHLPAYQFIILDSINDLGLKLEDFKALRKENPNAAFILVLQHTKDGNYRGGKDWEHHIEIGVSVENGVATVYRTRYGVKGALNFFNHFNTKPIQSASEFHQLNSANY